MSGENENIQSDAVQDLATPGDFVEPATERARQEDAPKVVETPKEPVEGSPFNEKRMSIAEKVRAQRQAKLDDPGIEIPEDMAHNYGGRKAETRGDRQRQAEEAKDRMVDPAANADLPAPARHKLKVNGRDVEVNDEQYRSLAQKAAASEQILEDAKLARAQAQQRLAEVERLMADHSRTVQPQPAPANAPAEDTKPATDDELDAIIDAIQVGDRKAAGEALKKFGADVGQQVLERARSELGNLDERIAATIQQNEVKSRVADESRRVVESFASENDDFGPTAPARRHAALFEATVDVMRENLFAIGVRPETLQNIAREKKLAPQAMISFAYSEMTKLGYPLPKHDVVLKTAATKVRSDFGMSAPATKAPARDTSTFVAERTERKQAMPSQPRRANTAPATDAPTNAQNRLESRKNAVAQMRASRRGR